VSYTNNGQILTCTYCSKLGHDISACYKRRNDEERASQNVRSENEPQSNMSGLRSIQQVVMSE
jgi:hypothetical protein